ncbi:hypothetical protein [Paraburkholderia sp. MM6662-R1]|uniref:hypothetical protein n=1 Tax=Paraburkholderia sp. MM6662-R1 TaxID=2991066 RepID=UPI003D1AD03F
MPARSFQVVIQNDSASLTLNKTFDHLCSGVYTAGWLPPMSIAPGASGGIQSESDGFMAPTEAYVKYDVDNGAGKQGMLYVYWHNPWAGNTTYKIGTDYTDILPDCDYSRPSGSSSAFNAPGPGLDFTCTYQFSTDASEAQTLPEVAILAGVTVTTGVGGVLAAIGELIGTTGIAPHAFLKIQVSDALNAPPVAPQLFGEQVDSVSIALLTKSTPQDWMGQWNYDNGLVDVIIQKAASGLGLQAMVNDGTTKPPLSFEQEFVIGPTSLVGPARAGLQALIEQQTQDPQLRAAFATAAETTIQLAAKTPLSYRSALNHFQNLVADVKTSTPTSVIQAQAVYVGRALGTLLNNQGAAVYLNNNVVLLLYGRFANARQIGSQIQFQRFDNLSMPITDVTLAHGGIAQ